MDIEEILEETVKELLGKIGADFTKIQISEEDKDSYHINIVSDNPSLLIGYKGANINALQQLIKVLTWKKAQNEAFNISVDVDDYRKRQEANIMSLVERKIDTVRKTGRTQILPPMSPYMRRKIHMQCLGPGFEDLETLSDGDGEDRHIIIKLK